VSRSPAPAPHAPPDRGSSPFVASLPLLASSVALFVLGYVVWGVAPHVGPGSFPLWDLLLVLGFVAAIGAVLSWMSADSRPGRAPNPPRSEPPAGPEPRPEFGRPRPEITSPPAPRPAGGLAAAMATMGPPRPVGPAEWSEDDIPILPSRPAYRLPPDESEPAVPSTDPGAADPRPLTNRRAPVDSVLDEIDEIQRDVGRRPRGPATSP
jgi:hypothetical protein